MHEDLKCTFGGVSIGDETASVGFKIERDGLDLARADQLFASTRLSGRITLKTVADDAQKNLPDMEDPKPTIETTFDVKRFGTSRKEYAARLTMAISDIDVSDLSHFAKRAGRLVIADVEELGDDEAGHDHDAFEGENGDVPGQKRFDVDDALGGGDEGAELGIINLETSKLRSITGDKSITGIGKKMAENICVAVGGATIGHLEKAMRDNEWWHRDIKGVGVDGVDKIVDALAILRKEYPVPMEE